MEVKMMEDGGLWVDLFWNFLIVFISIFRFVYCVCSQKENSNQNLGNIRQNSIYKGLTPTYRYSWELTPAKHYFSIDGHSNAKKIQALQNGERPTYHHRHQSWGDTGSWVQWFSASQAYLLQFPQDYPRSILLPCHHITPINMNNMNTNITATHS